MAVRQDYDKTRLKLTDEFCDQLPISNILYNIATTSLFNAIDREAKELLPRSIFIITRHYKRVKV